MAKRGKKYISLRSKKKTDIYSLEEAVKNVKKLSYSKFEGTVELHLALKLPKDTDAKSVKTSLALPHSMGKQVRIAVFTSPENQDAAKKAGADLVGLEDLMKQIKDGKIDFDIAIATPDVMPKIAVLGRELGPKGLMPNPKTGTVPDASKLADTVKEYKQGKINIAADSTGVMHLAVGKIKTEDAKIVENTNSAIKAIVDLIGKMPNQVIKSAYLAPTMGMSVRFNYTPAEV